MLGKAISIASQAFENKKDKGGQPYILHCLYVMNEVKHISHEAMIIAVLHDLLEDTNWTSMELMDAGFTNAIIRRIENLTHREDENYDTYIKRVSLDKLCTYIKLADLRHNSDITRMKGLTKKDFDRLEKYHKAYEYLRESN